LVEERPEAALVVGQSVLAADSFAKLDNDKKIILKFFYLFEVIEK